MAILFYDFLTHILSFGEIGGMFIINGCQRHLNLTKAFKFARFFIR
jgi:hypothetical protein